MSHIAKKHSRKGVFKLHNKRLIERALSYYSVDELWGVGRKQTQFLNDKGIFQASQLAQTDEAWLKIMSILGVRYGKRVKWYTLF